MSSKFPRCGNSLYFNLLESNLIQSYVSKPIIHNCRYFQSLIVHVCALILPNVLCVLQWMDSVTGMNQAVSVCVQRNHSKYVKMDTYLIFNRPAGKHVRIFALIFHWHSDTYDFRYSKFVSLTKPQFYFITSLYSIPYCSNSENWF